jgi:hypothetical protein
VRAWGRLFKKVRTQSELSRGAGVFKRISEPAEKFVLSQRWHFAPTEKFARSRSLKKKTLAAGSFSHWKFLHLWNFRLKS